MSHGFSCRFDRQTGAARIARKGSEAVCFVSAFQRSPGHAPRYRLVACNHDAAPFLIWHFDNIKDLEFAVAEFFAAHRRTSERHGWAALVHAFEVGGELRQTREHERTET